jgi:hypothetical protein
MGGWHEEKVGRGVKKGREKEECGRWGKGGREKKDRWWREFVKRETETRPGRGRKG